MENTVTLTPYLYFNNNCREAMDFYKGIFGGEVELHTFAELSGSTDPETKDNIMHSELKGGAVKFFACDAGDRQSGNIQLAVSGPEEQRLRGFFDALGEGGRVTSPLQKMSWGDLFGSVTDKYGIGWMFNIGAGNASAA